MAKEYPPVNLNFDEVADLYSALSEGKLKLKEVKQSSGLDIGISKKITRYEKLQEKLMTWMQTNA